MKNNREKKTSNIKRTSINFLNAVFSKYCNDDACVS